MQYRRANDGSVFQPVASASPDTPNGFDYILLLLFSVAAASYTYFITHKPHD